MTEGVKEEDVFTVFTDKSGRKYFYGDIIDEKLVGNNYSVWSFTAGVLQKYNEPFTDVGKCSATLRQTQGAQALAK